MRDLDDDDLARSVEGLEHSLVTLIDKFRNDSTVDCCGNDPNKLFFWSCMTGVGPKCSMGMRNRTEYLVLFMRVWVIWRSFGGLAGPKLKVGLKEK